METKLSEIRRLQCCCCGGEAIGRQWHNRDIGYGLCSKCADFVSTKESPEEMHSNYGVKGVNYSVTNF